MPVQITGNISNGGAILVTSTGDKIAVVRDGAATVIVYKDVDGTPTTVASATATTIHGTSGTLIYALHAAIDGNDDIHVVSAASTNDTRDIAYAVCDLTTGFGSWEEAGSYTDAVPSTRAAKISLDSSDVPHVLYIDAITSKGTTADQIMHADRTGGTWSQEQVSERADKADVYSQAKITLRGSDVIEAFYLFSTSTDASYRTKSGGSWGTETDISATQPTIFDLTATTGGTVYRYWREVGASNLIYEGSTSTGYYALLGSPTLVGTKRYLFMLNTSSDIQLISNDGGGWTNEGTLQTGTYTGIIACYSYNNNNDSGEISYIFQDASYTYYDSFSLGTATSDNQSAYSHGSDSASDNQITFLKGSSSSSDSQTAYLKGGTAAQDNQFAYAHGLDSASDNQIVFLQGSTDTSDNQQAFLSGALGASDNQPAYTHGLDLASDNQSAYTDGSQDTSSSRYSYLAGKMVITDSQFAFLAGGVNTSDSQFAYTEGGSPAGTDPSISWAIVTIPLSYAGTASDSQSAYLFGVILVTDNQPAFTKGSSDITTSLGAYTQGQDTASSTKSAYLTGSININSDISAYTHGLSTSQDSQPAFALGTLGASDNQAVYLAGISTASDSQPAFTIGSQDTQDNQPAYTEGIAGAYGTQSAYLKGQNSAAENQAAYITGSQDASDFQAAYTFGGLSASSSINAYLNSEGTVSSQEAYLAGAGPVSSSQSAYMDATWFGTIDVEIDQDIDDSFARNGTEFPNSTTVDLNYSGPYLVRAAFRFRNINIPNQSTYSVTITKAYFTGRTYSTSYDDPETTITGEYTVNATPPEGGLYIPDRTPTTASVLWSDSAVGINWVDSPDISAIIQEIVDIPAWDLGKAICIMMDDDETLKYFRIRDYQYIIATFRYPAKLHIEFVVGSVTGQVAYLAGISSSSTSVSAFTVGGVADSQPAYTDGIGVISDSQSAFTAGGITASDDTPAYTQGTGDISWQPAYTHGIESNTSSQSAFVVGGIASSQSAMVMGLTVGPTIPAYTEGVGVLSYTLSGYTSGTSTDSSTQSAYLTGNIAASSSQSAFVNSGQLTATSRQKAYISADIKSSQSAYLEGLSTVNDYVIISTLDRGTSLRFSVLAENYADTMYETGRITHKTIPGGLDITSGTLRRKWSPTIKVKYTESRAGYGTVSDLETLYTSDGPVLWQDHYGREYKASIRGNLRKSLVGIAIEGSGSIFMVQIDLLEELNP